MNRNLRCIFCLLTLFFAVHSSYGGDSEDRIELSLQECISLALKANLDIRIQRISPQIQNALVTKTKSIFDPSAALGSSTSQSEEPLSTPGADVRTGENQGLNLSITDPIVTGGSYDVSFNSSRSESNSELQTLNPAYRSGLTLSLNQPLLEGFGIGVNRASITIAKNNRDISILQLKSQLIGTLSDVQGAYWDLVFELENLKVQQLALKQAQDLLNINQRFKEQGKATISDILQAQAAVASREADVIAARDAVKDSEDTLKRIINLVENPKPGAPELKEGLDETIWDMTILPLDTPPLEHLEVDIQEGIITALKNRPEYAQAKLGLENSDISIKLARNRRLPVLDLEGSYTLNGLGDKFSDPLSDVGENRYKSWYVGLALRVPLGERGSRAELRKSQHEKEQQLLIFKDLEQQIITEVRGAVRQLETDGKRIEATKAAADLARQVLTTEERKHGLGLSTSYEVLQFQANLATATKNHLRAVIDYQKSIVVLYQTLGATLEKLNIEIEG